MEVSPDNEQELANRLATTPLIVFKLIASADGRPTDAHAKALEALLSDIETSPPSLLKMLFLAVTRPQLEPLLDRVNQLSFKDMSAELKDLGTIVDQKFPNESDSFKNGLIAIGNRIAGADGAEASDNAKAILVHLASTLGLVAEENE